MPAVEVRKLAIDAKDIVILRELVQGAAGRFPSEKISVDVVARAVGMHPNTVADRLKRIREAGWFLPMTVLPVPSVVGLSMGRFFVPMTMAQRTPERLAKVMEFPCFYVMDLLEGWEPTLFAADDAELEANARQIVELLGGIEPEWTIRASRDWPAMPGIELDETDLAIFEALLADAHTPLDDLAGRLGIHPRTLRRRHDRLRDKGAFRINPHGTGAMTTGISMRQFQLTLPPAGVERAATEQAIDLLLPNLFGRGNLVGSAWYVIYGDEPGELQAQVEKVAALSGVTLLNNRHLRRYIPNPDYPKHIMRLLRNKLTDGAPQSS